MSSLAVLVAGIAIVLLVYWVLRNEGAKTVKEQTGLFRMRDWEAEDKEREAKQAKKKQVLR